MTQGTTKGVPIDTDGTLGTNSDQLVASQKATKTYVDAQIVASGDISGPISSTDNAIATWDGTSGNVLQDTLVLIDDSDNMTGVASINVNSTIAVDGFIDDDTMATASATTLPTSESVKAYVDTNAGASTTAVNQVAHGFTGGEWVYLNGSTYTAAIATSAAAAEVVGVVESVAGVDDFTLQGDGFVTTLSGLTKGTVYFLSPTSAGDLTATAPTTNTQIVKPLLVATSTTSGLIPNYRGELLTDAIEKISQDGAEIYAADGGASDTYVITLSPVPASYTTGMVINFKANTANTGAATLNVNSLGAKSILKLHDTALANNDIEAGQIVTVVYDGTNFQMQSQIANAAAGGGDFVKISTTTASASASVAFTNLSGTYSEYIVVLENVLPATDNTDLWIRTSTDNGATYDSTSGHYQWGCSQYAAGRQDSWDTATATTSINITGVGTQGVSSTAGEGVSGEVKLFGHADVVYTTVNSVVSFMGHSTNYVAVTNSAGKRTSAADVDAIQFLFSSGNIASGVFTLYGVTA